MEFDGDEAAETPITIDIPSPARMYDYFLGGSHNFPADRQAAERMLAVYPDIALIMRANRAFLRRAVRFLVGQGIDQFLDIGSGIPTAGSVHEIVHRHNPAAHVVYVDSDPIAVEHNLAMLVDTPSATIIQADARQPERILTHPDVGRLLDFNRPVAVILAALLHFVVDDVVASNVVDTRGRPPPVSSRCQSVDRLAMLCEYGWHLGPCSRKGRVWRSELTKLLHRGIRTMRRRP